MHAEAPTIALPLKMAVTSTQAAFVTTDDGGAISMLFDAFELRWPVPNGRDLQASLLRAERTIGVIGQPGASLAIDVRGSCVPDTIVGIGAAVEISHLGGETAVSPVPVGSQIDCRIEGRFNASGRFRLAVQISLDGAAGGGCDRLIVIDSIEITTL